VVVVVMVVAVMELMAASYSYLQLF